MTAEHEKVASLSSRLRESARSQRPNPQELSHLERMIARLRDDQQFSILFAPFETGSPDSNFQIQDHAGRLLERLRPRCQRPVCDVLRASLSHWNLSVAALPRYLVSAFGERAVLDALASLEVTELTAAESRALETIRFWLRENR